MGASRCAAVAAPVPAAVRAGSGSGGGQRCRCTGSRRGCGRSCGCGRGSARGCRSTTCGSCRTRPPPTPVHWRPHGLRGRRNPRTGEWERVQDVPVPVYLPREAHEGLWGGEGWIRGFRYARNDKLSTRLPKTWKPQLFERQFYSEILDATLTITVTMRTLDLIDEAYGFDFYILKTPKADMCSKLGMDLKRTMLLRLARRDPKLHPDDPAKREAIYNKYKEFVIPEEEAEWVGLSLEEAIEKQRLLEKKDPVPLFKVYAEELVNQLKEQAEKKQ
uniref:Large ribosomal subunit protein bL28m n=1 Tax=Melopsittacus undulatus TaxID=13146 RepID=A0A8V5FTE9_MELUD